jgi:hypothetical protein
MEHRRRRRFLCPAHEIRTTCMTATPSRLFMNQAPGKNSPTTRVCGDAPVFLCIPPNDCARDFILIIWESISTS